MTPYILVIDIGTTSTKVIAFSQKGSLLQEAKGSYEILEPKSGYKEQSPSEIYKALMKATAKVIQACAIPPIAITFSSAMHSLIAVDEKNETLTNSLIWADGRSQQYADELKGTALGDKLYQQTGTPIHPMSPLCKLAWLRDHQSDVFAQAACFISIKEYVLFQWLDQYVVDESIASASGLFDIHLRKWSKAALTYAHIDETQLSTVVPTKHIFHQLSSKVAAQLNIPTTTPIVIGASDGCVANIGANVKGMGEAAMSIGTSAAIRITYDTPILDTDYYLFNYIIDEKTYAIGGASNSGGIVREWLRENFARGKNVADINIGAEGLLFLPYLVGERAPIWDAHARAAFIGLQKKHTQAHLERAVLEGIAMNLYQIMSALEKATSPIQQVYANGGFTQNHIAMQIIADVFDATIHLQVHEEGTALGAARLAYAALSIDMKEPTEQIHQSFSPRTIRHQRYVQYYKVWKELYGQLENSFEALRRLAR